MATRSRCNFRTLEYELSHGRLNHAPIWFSYEITVSRSPFCNAVRKADTVAGAAVVPIEGPIGKRDAEFLGGVCRIDPHDPGAVVRLGVVASVVARVVNRYHSAVWVNPGGSRPQESVSWQEHRDERVCCTLEAQTIRQRFFDLDGTEPREEFQQWAVSFYSELRRAHPRSKAQRVAHAIRSSHDQPLRVRSLAADVGLTTSALIRAFRNEFRCTPNEYQRALRLIEAVDRIPSDKIEAVAREVGYRSKKNFYRLFKNLTGLTPSAFRRLPGHEQRVVVLEARRRINVK